MLPIAPFAFNVWTNSKACIQTLCLNFPEEPHQVVSSFEVVLKCTQTNLKLLTACTFYSFELLLSCNLKL